MTPVQGIPPIGAAAAPSPVRDSFAALAGRGRIAGGEAHPALSLPGPRGVVSSAPVVHALERLRVAQARMDTVLRLAASGRSFRPAELLALQAGIAHASQVLDLSGRVVERVSSAVKQVLQTQV
jgi:hypothetical protein